MKSSERLITVPFQIIETYNSIIIKRGRIEVKISGDNIAEVLQTIIKKINNGGATKAEICELFEEQHRPAVAMLIDGLVKRRLLIPPTQQISKDETELDIFRWHFEDEVIGRIDDLKSKNIVIIGINSISYQLEKSLRNSGFERIIIVDYPMLRSTRFSGRLENPTFSTEPVDYKKLENNIKPNDIDCVIATCDFGAIPQLRRWNEFCIEQNIIFLPIILQDLIGYIGPIVVPDQTACFECLLSRRNANIGNSDLNDLSEMTFFEMQKVIGYHPIMASILADIATMELIKFYGAIGGILNVGKLIRINMLASQLDSHHIMRIPKCKTCSKLNKRPSTNLIKSIKL